MLDALLMELALRYERLEEVIGEYRQRCSTIGREVRVVRADGELVGRAAAVADDGSLVVVTEGGGEVTVAAGDVVHLRPGEPGAT